MSEYFRTHARDLQQKGYDPVPIPLRRKAIFDKGWQQNDYTETIEHPTFREGKRGVSHRTRAAPAIDVDVVDPDIANQLAEFLHDKGFLARRYGLRPKFACIGQWPAAAEKKRTSAAYECGKIEILGDGQQLVMFNIHPDTNEPYEWTDELKPVRELPLVTEDLIEELFDLFETLAAASYQLVEARSAPPAGSAPPVEQLSDSEIVSRLSGYDPNCSYDEWVRVGMAIKHHGGTVELWDHWSIFGHDYPGTEAIVKKWDTFDTDGSKASLEVNVEDIMEMYSAGVDVIEQQQAERTGHAWFKPLRDMLSNRIDPDWLIKGVLERDTVSLLFGDFVAFKSFIALDLALHVAAGMRWRDRHTTAGPVFYLAGEGHGGLDRRVQAWSEHHNVSDAPFHRSTIPANLTDTQHMHAMAAAMDHIAEVKPALVVIDTLASSAGGGDENSATDVSMMLDEVNKIRRMFHCAVLIVHHTGQKEKDRARGSYALPAGVDTMYRANRMGESMEVTLTNTKMKDGRPPEPMIFEAVEVVLGQDSDGEDVTSLILAHEQLSLAASAAIGLKLRGRSRAAFEILFDAGGEMKADEWSEACRGTLSKQAFHRAKKHLMDLGIVVESGAGGVVSLPAYG